MNDTSREGGGKGASCTVKGGQPGQNFVGCSWQVILMPLVSNKVGDDCTRGTNTASVDGKAMVDTLNKVSLILQVRFYSLF